jgi:hypothetical protein
MLLVCCYLCGTISLSIQHDLSQYKVLSMKNMMQLYNSLLHMLHMFVFDTIVGKIGLHCTASYQTIASDLVRQMISGAIYH